MNKCKPSSSYLSKGHTGKVTDIFTRVSKIEKIRWRIFIQDVTAETIQAYMRAKRKILKLALKEEVDNIEWYSSGIHEEVQIRDLTDRPASVWFLTEVHSRKLTYDCKST